MATAPDPRNKRAPSSTRDSHALSFLDRAFKKELARVARSIRHSYVQKIRTLKSEISDLRAQLAVHAKSQQSPTPCLREQLSKQPKPVVLPPSETQSPVPLCTLSNFWEPKVRYSPAFRTQAATSGRFSSTQVQSPPQQEIRTSETRIAEVSAPLTLGKAEPVPKALPISSVAPTSPQTAQLDPREQLAKFRERMRNSPFMHPKLEDC